MYSSAICLRRAARRQALIQRFLVTEHRWGRYRGRKSAPPPPPKGSSSAVQAHKPTKALPSLLPPTVLARPHPSSNSFLFRPATLRPRLQADDRCCTYMNMLCAASPAVQVPVAVNVAPVKVLTSVFPHAQGDVVRCLACLSCLYLDSWSLLRHACILLPSVARLSWSVICAFF